MNPQRTLAALGAACLVGSLLLAGGCATPPKPPELEALERLRSDPSTEAAVKRNPDLVKGADVFLAQAREEWQDNDLDDARKAALLGQIKLKHAIALSDQEKARRRSAAADQELRRAKDELAQAQRDLAGLEQQIGLLRKLNEATAERQKLTEQISVEQQQTAAERAIGDAELALKTAETLNAVHYAAAPFNTASESLKRARQELQQGQPAAAQKSAEIARINAEQAAAAARPRYEQDLKSAENRAQAEALARDAAQIAGLTVRREARGSLQRLVLPLPAANLFVRRSTTIAPDRGQELDAIAALLKKYPNYPVQVVGYTDNRGRTNELLALSLARAQSVYQALILRGVDPKRLVVSGQGSAEPIEDNRATVGRARNNRVEIVFLYQ